MLPKSVIMASNDKVFAMKFTFVYPMLIQKAERKGRSRAEVLEITQWLTGYTPQQLEDMLLTDINYGDFLRNAPLWNPASSKITGTICGIKVENIEDPLMQKLRYLDKLVDELAKGKDMEKIKRS